jgi:hypothetical protein
MTSVIYLLLNHHATEGTEPEFKVGDMIDYWAPATIVFIASNLRTGIITEIYSDEGWDESDDMHVFHLTVGMDPITYGSYIRPVNGDMGGTMLRVIAIIVP